MKTSINKSFSQIAHLGKDNFEILYHISKILNSAAYEENLIEDTLDIIIEVLHAERGVFVKYNEFENSFSILAARNVKKESITDLSEFSSGIFQQVVEQRKPKLYHDVPSDPEVSQFKSVMLQNIKSVLGVPIIRNDDIWGVILADSRLNRKEFSKDNLIFVDFISNLVSLALEKILGMEAIRRENIILKNQIESTQQLPDIIGESKAMKEVASLIHKVAPTDATVLILGESGTGKDLVARAIHKLSNRNEKPFLAQFCGSIPDTLLESELFGYKKGAFSGAATDKKGLFEVADKGTFFLDEIGDISQALQAKLLRVLQNKEIIRLGDTSVVKVDVRIITATNKDLKALTRENAFREDLFYRLNVFPVKLPPLRDRKTDISLLVKHFITKYSNDAISIQPATLKKLETYNWPGNVRQLENAIQRALILCTEKSLRPDHIIIEERDDSDTFDGTLSDFEKSLLEKKLKEFDGNRTRTAKALGVSTRWVQLKIKEMEQDGKYDID